MVVKSLKYPLGDRVVIAFPMPLRDDLTGLGINRPWIPTAQMNSEGETVEPGDDRVVGRNRTLQVFIRISATGFASA